MARENASTWLCVARMRPPIPKFHSYWAMCVCGAAKVSHEMVVMSECSRQRYVPRASAEDAEGMFTFPFNGSAGAIHFGLSFAHENYRRICGFTFRLRRCAWLGLRVSERECSR